MENLINDLSQFANVKTLATVRHKNQDFPIYSITLEKNLDPALPSVTFVGGVHGLERIGSQVILSYLRTFCEYLQWDENAHELLKKVRLHFIPLLNPVGTHLGNRANGNGVDLMRNAPVDSPEKGGFLALYRGHRLSNQLPWYRGKKEGPMEEESQALHGFVKGTLFQSRLSICVDVHSGYGAMDRLWFPYAKSRELFPNIAEVFTLKKFLDRTLPNHVYQIEPQSHQYTVHGDLWDYFYEEHRKLHLGSTHPRSLFIPLTLEMGSWNWLKKNPFQILRPLGLFHPLKIHRIRRVLRRHGPLFDFLTRITANPKAWTQLETEKKSEASHEAQRLWSFAPLI